MGLPEDRRKQYRRRGREAGSGKGPQQPRVALRRVMPQTTLPQHKGCKQCAQVPAFRARKLMQLFTTGVWKQNAHDRARSVCMFLPDVDARPGKSVLPTPRLAQPVFSSHARRNHKHGGQPVWNHDQTRQPPWRFAAYHISSGFREDRVM